MSGHVSIVEVTVTLEGALEVVRQNSGGYDLLAFDWLGTGLCIVLAHVLVVSSAEANSTLLTLMTDIDTNKHGLR